MHIRRRACRFRTSSGISTARSSGFSSDGLTELFKEFSPITDYSGKKFELRFESFEVGEPKYDEDFARENIRTYEAPVKATVKLINKTLGSEKTQEIFLADMPLMTPHGSFIVSGVERVIVPQLARSFGAFFVSELLRGKPFFGAKIIPLRAACGLNSNRKPTALFL